MPLAGNYFWTHMAAPPFQYPRGVPSLYPRAGYQAQPFGFGSTDQAIANT